MATYSQAFGMILCSGAMQKYQPVGGQACQKRFLGAHRLTGQAKSSGFVGFLGATGWPGIIKTVSQRIIAGFMALFCLPLCPGISPHLKPL
jgi:hypothetical protein